MSVLWPAFFAGVIAIGVTVAVERFGGLKGGLIGTLPTTIVPAAIGIFAQGDPTGFALAMYAVPFGMLMNALFLAVWSALPPRLPNWTAPVRLFVTSGVSLGLWFALAAALVLWVQERVALGPGIAATVALTCLGLLFTARTTASPKGTRRVGAIVLLCRGLGAAVAIAVAVLLAAGGNDVAAGIASVFPAIFVTTMVALWFSQGEAVPVGAAGPMMVGSTSVAIFALIVARTIPAFGTVAGTAIAWSAAAGLQLPLFALARAVLGRAVKATRAGTT